MLWRVEINHGGISDEACNYVFRYPINYFLMSRTSRVADLLSEISMSTAQLTLQLNKQDNCMTCTKGPYDLERTDLVK